MPTIVGILIFISRIDTTSESLKQKKKTKQKNNIFFIIRYLWAIEIPCLVGLGMKKVL